MTELKLNDTAPDATEKEALDRIVLRMSARFVSLYRTREGLCALVIDGAGAEHLGVPIGKRVKS